MANPLPPPPAISEHVTVLDAWAVYSDAPNAFYKSLLDEALPPLAVRKLAVDKLATRADWERYRLEARQKIADVVGPFPAKSPLNARVTGVVDKAGYRIEKIVYESQPGFHVTAALFVPAGLQGKAPAIVYCSGHSDESFRAPPYLSLIVNLVLKGFVVLAFDPIGQGERLQYFNPAAGRSEFGKNSSTREHSHVGNQCFLTGDSLARYMIWDGIRSVDYLMTRPEVDVARIGITGRSGGGTQSAYIAAVDERILAAAPENYLTTFESVMKMRGPQDAEQNFYRGIARGFDLPDLLIARAPKPTLIVATSRDIFNIEGARTTLAEARRAHAALGGVETVTMTVDDAEHSSTPKNREATYAFFQRHLRLPGSAADGKIEVLSDAELRITATEQVATALQSETVFAINRRRADAIAQGLHDRRRDLASHLATVKTEAARLAGRKPASTAAQAVVFCGRFQREGYALEKYLLPVDDRYAIPLLVMVPEAKAEKVVLYLHPGGKAAQAAVGGEMEALVKQGCAVVALDVIGTGELGPGRVSAERDGPHRLWYGYVLLGQSMIGRQMSDVVRTVKFAQSRFGVSNDALVGIARAEMGPLLLHTAALEGLFSHVALLDAPLSYRAMVTVPRYAANYVGAMVAGALAAYDLPDLAAVLAPRKLLVANPRNGAGAPAGAEAVAQELAVVRRAFAAQSAPERFVAVGSTDKVVSSPAFAAWLQ